MSQREMTVESIFDIVPGSVSSADANELVSMLDICFAFQRVYGGIVEGGEDEAVIVLPDSYVRFSCVVERDVVFDILRIVVSQGESSVSISVGDLDSVKAAIECGVVFLAEGNPFV